jgi:hypothetical protein
MSSAVSLILSVVACACSLCLYINFVGDCGGFNVMSCLWGIEESIVRGIQWSWWVVLKFCVRDS